MMWKKLLFTLSTLSLSAATWLLADHHHHHKDHHHKDHHKDHHHKDHHHKDRHHECCRCAPDELPHSQYRRVLVFSQNLPTSEQPPFTDPNHATALTYQNNGQLVYTPAEVAQLDPNAFQQFNTYFGLDFNSPNVIILPNGVRIIPGTNPGDPPVATYIPFFIGVNKNVVKIADVKCGEQKEDAGIGKDYYVIAGGLVLIGNAPYPVTSGVNAGATLPPGALLVSGSLKILSIDSNKVETFRIETSQSGLSTIDQWGTQSEIFVMDVYDEHGHKGTFRSAAVHVKIPPGTDGVEWTQEFPVIAFPCENCFIQ